MKNTNHHDLRCDTCKNKRGIKNIDSAGESFYATKRGIMICTINNEPILFSDYIRTCTHGCASHSNADIIIRKKD